MLILTQGREILNFDSCLNSKTHVDIGDVHHKKEIDYTREENNVVIDNYGIFINYYGLESYYKAVVLAKYSSRKVCEKVFEDFWNALKNDEKYFEFPADNPEGEE